MLFKDVKAGQLFRQDGTVWLKISSGHVDNDYNAVVIRTAEKEFKDNLRVDAIYELSYE